MSHNSVTLWEKNRGQLGNCRSILQEIVWMIDNWENSLRPYNIVRKEEEITNCEDALMKVKDMIWTSCLTMFSKYDPQTKQLKGATGQLMVSQPEMTAARTEKTNAEVMYHESNNIPVAVHQRQATQTVVVSNSPHQQILRNLLLEWAVIINPHFQLCLVGTLPNDGAWETSPISVRIAPRTVKTISGTVYNMHGEMVVREDADIPDFVQEKFRDGFPPDWKNVANKWISMLKAESCGYSGPRVSDEHAELEPRVYLKDIGQRRTVTSNQVPRQTEKIITEAVAKDKFTREPPAKRKGGDIRNRVPSNTSPVIRSTKYQEEESSDDDDDEEEIVTSNSRMPANTVVRRHSKRILSKSLMESTYISDDESSLPQVDEKKFNYLKDWSMGLSTRKSYLILCGTLLDDTGRVVSENHHSKAISKRVHADVIAVQGGELYRLIGPSSSNSRDFVFGFPVHWKNLLPKYKEAAIQQAKNLQREREGMRTRRALPSSEANLQAKRHTSMINQTVKNQLTKAQSSMIEAIKNVNNKSRNENASIKRGPDSVSLHSRQVAPMKKKKLLSIGDKEQDRVKANNDSVANLSVDENEWKQEVIKRMQNNGKDKVEEKRTQAAEPSQLNQTETPKIPAKPVKTVKPVRMSDDKYGLGLATDDCQSENEFNIF